MYRLVESKVVQVLYESRWVYNHDFLGRIDIVADNQSRCFTYDQAEL